MKKAYLLLAVLLVCLLITACGKVEPAVQDNTVPPVSDNNDKDAVNDGTPPADNKDITDVKDPDGSSADTPPVDSTPDAEIVCEFDTVALKCFKRGSGYIRIEDGWKVETRVNELEYTFGGDFVDGIYKLLKQIDTTMNPKPESDIISYTARFYNCDGGTEELIVFSPPRGGTEYGANRVWVKVSEQERRPLTIEASEEFMRRCNNKGLKDNRFFSDKSITTEIDWLFSLAKRQPILVYDENRELTPEQVVEQSLYNLGKELTQPAVDRFFIIKDYEGWGYAIYSNKEEDESIRNHPLYGLSGLTDDQYVVVPRGIRGIYEGLSNDGMYDSHFFLEYEAGIWRLWLRSCP